MKVWVVLDHVCEADIVIGVFSKEETAKAFVKHNSWPHVNDFRYESLGIEEHELDCVPVRK